MTPIKRIRAYCIKCVGNSYRRVRSCQYDKCPLHRYRLGHNPARAGIGGQPSHFFVRNLVNG